MSDHVSALDQAAAHVHESQLRMRDTARSVERSIDCVVRSDEHVESSIERVARGHVRRVLHRTGASARVR